MYRGRHTSGTRHRAMVPAWLSRELLETAEEPSIPDFQRRRTIAAGIGIERRRLAAVLDEWRVEVGHVWLVNPAQRFANVTVQRFVELAIERIGAAPWASTVP